MKKKENPYTVPEYLHFLAVCTKGFVISGAGTANLSGAPKFTPSV
jgi:hypothetical protein